ncbi:hypothetical protein [endosymbiont GvMRE of Glomus versiforme]|uniref:hypothetical protein n=1 Tax=endosymbiont GvMRE of Glomus versiforme TaxID=2039283 RepID=UPI000EBDE4BA|nr:hypothetical protein [endosymbiont GvMRE of Glomus versiforme]RHZ36775.1 hypothetical protein GvMRE_I2g176 [endosymbiont GvMRE of Glomus versiforme]
MIENYYLITKGYLSEKEAEQALGSNWKSQINNCSSFDKIMNKYDQLKGKLEKYWTKISDAKNKAFNDILNYKKDEKSIYFSSIEKELPSHLANGRWKDYLNESQSLTQLNSRQKEIEKAIDKGAEKSEKTDNYRNYNSKNRGTGITEIIIGLLIIGAIIGLIIWLVKRNKNKEQN